MSVKWMKTGAESTALAQQEKVNQEIKKAAQGKMWRFWMTIGEECRVTFIDGELNNEGYLEPPRFYEHQLFMNGSWQNWYICPQMTIPHSNDTCPICLSKDAPYLASVFTVIDHREFSSKKDQNKKFKDTPKLLVVKPDSMEMLQKIAAKRGGLAGCTFDVSRTGDKSPNIGNMYDFCEKQEIEVLQKKYTREIVDPTNNQKSIQTFFVPADYEKEIQFLTGEELVKLGLGAPKVAGYTPPGANTGSNGGTDYSKEL